MGSFITSMFGWNKCSKIHGQKFHKFHFKDTMKAFDDFKNKQQKCMK